MDFAFGKIFLIFVVGMLVLGPEKMIKAARMAGFWLAKMRQMSQSAKDQWNEISAAQELQALKEQIENTGAQVKEQLQSGAQHLEQLQQDVAHQIQPISDAFSQPLQLDPSGYPQPGSSFDTDATGFSNPPASSVKRSAKKQLDHAHPLTIASSHTDGRSLRQKKASLLRTSARLSVRSPVRRKL